jgi:predicted lipid-binding transport protein (Tim44 family)
MKLLSVLPLAELAAVLRRNRLTPVGVSVAATPSRAESGAALPHGYSPGNVGNDASARPWEQVEPLGESDRTALRPTDAAPVPAGFDAAGFLEVSKAHFVAMQAAWDRIDMAALRAMMGTELLGQLQAQLAERERQAGAPTTQTEIVMLDAQLLGVEAQSSGHLASIEFSGLAREDSSTGPSPFREVWTISCPRDGAPGWLVTGVQAFA